MSGHDDDDFYNGLALSPATTAMDTHLQEQGIGGSKFTSLQGLTDKGRYENALPLPTEAGQRVSFIANIGSVLTYSHIPEAGVEGTVVMVRTAEGDTTHNGDDVFVKWDDGQFQAIHRQFLRASKGKKQASSFCRRASGLGSLHEFLRRSDDSNELIHKSTQDLWAFEETDDGVVLSRLFDDVGMPLKA